ncbi:MAG: hypothetical protein J0M12_11965, partial [Deltaproteobacteria bacterium]|nr:hypothetical protein [Deltaproteobacteria bacterium]
MNVLNSSDESIEIDSEVSVALSSGLAKPILGGHVRFFGYLTDETLPREAALLVDETTLPGSEVGESALSSCGEGCAMALFGNGQPSIPAPAASASIGY